MIFETSCKRIEYRLRVGNSSFSVFEHNIHDSCIRASVELVVNGLGVLCFPVYGYVVNVQPQL